MKRITSLLLALVLILSVAPISTFAPVYANEQNYQCLNLTPGTRETEMRFTWQSPATAGEIKIWRQGDISTVRSISSTVGNVFVDNRRTHRVTVNNLEPNTVYDYTVTWNGGESPTKTFKTGGADNFSFFAVSDIQIGTNGAGFDGGDWRTLMDVATATSPKSQFILSLGDQHTATTSVNAQRMLDAVMSPEQLHSLPFAPTLGNHDVSTTGNPFWHNYFNTPIQGAPNVRRWRDQNETQFDYYFRYGNVLFINLDSNIPSNAGWRCWLTNGSSNTARLDWVTNVVQQNADATWRVVSFHNSPYSANRPTNDSGKNNVNTWLPSFDALGIDIIFGGHDHIYSRSHHMRGNNSNIDSRRQLSQRWVSESGTIHNGAFGDEHNAVLNPTGITYISLGSATRSNVRPPDNPKSGERSYLLRVDKDSYRAPEGATGDARYVDNLMSFSVVDVTPDTFSVTTYNVDNSSGEPSMTDVYTIVKNPNGNSLPPGVVIPKFGDIENNSDGSVYNMQTDKILSRFVSGSHTLLANVRSATKIVNTTSTPRTITLTGRSGTSQGIDIKLAELLKRTKPGHSYKIEFSGRVEPNPNPDDATTGPWSIFFQTAVGSVAGTNLTPQVQTGANGAFAIEATLKHEEIAVHAAVTDQTYRLGGASMQNLIVDKILITEQETIVLPTYTITFNPQSGVVNPTSAVTNTDGRLTSLPTPTRDGYKFEGWFTSATGGDAVTTARTYSADTTIHAHWTLITYTVTFNPRGGTVTPTTAVTDANRRLTSLPVPTRDGYTFMGWYTSATGGTAVTTANTYNADTTIFAQWERNVYNITLNAHGGEVTPSVVHTGDDYTLLYLGTLPTPTRAGYAFNGWFTTATGNTPVDLGRVYTADATIHAQWSEIFTIAFDAQGGSVTPASAVTGKNGKLTLATLPTPTRTGYTFAGWFTETNGGGTQINLDTPYTASRTVYANWSLIPIVVTFEPNQGTVSPANATVGANGRLSSLPTPTRDNFAFNGWFTEATGGEPVTLENVYSENTTIHAQWSQIRTVTFNAQGGTVTPATAQTGVFGRLTLTELPTPTRDNFIFNGWFTSATGNTKVDLNRVYTSNATIHAQWTAVTHTVTFDANGGNVTPEFTVTNDERMLEALPQPTRTGYKFAGWFTEATGGDIIMLDRVYTDDVTIYAQWADNYTVMFDVCGGTLPNGAPESVIVNDENKLMTLPVPTHGGFAFDGWFTLEQG
ncbi:MAG: InlB B-repeat-containing protein, partial [Oscillospiraceae bacterium]|nr:InlB B-repeat-containing protein [Oscillospiraceae bacterium]